MKTLRPVEWVGGPNGHLRALDQRLLPGKVVYRTYRNVPELWEAIRNLTVRGAPAIGVAAAFAAYLGVRDRQDLEPRLFLRGLRAVCDYLVTARPTAVNLPWAIERMYSLAVECSTPLPGGVPANASGRARFLPSKEQRAESKEQRAGSCEWASILPSRSRATGVPSVPRLKSALLAEAKAIWAEDRAACKAIGDHGLRLLRNGMTVLTHCNAGALATSEYGTALAPIYRAHERGWKIRVFADETRPLLQGARLTAWELKRAGIPVTILCDNAAAGLLASGKIDCVITGADRIAANGDSANKVGTLGVAILAAAYGVPFYMAAPFSSVDLSLPNGKRIPIEHRQA
ncbi:MAG: S-methyl-5-thioribose-1-phosphate isomerase, partial [Planctomycetota bacterium]|nr:S-methyl-5-thioribose-1-phosphate isomerase [Planctomycetota bacterium]